MYISNPFFRIVNHFQSQITSACRWKHPPALYDTHFLYLSESLNYLSFFKTFSSLKKYHKIILWHITSSTFRGKKMHPSVYMVSFFILFFWWLDDLYQKTEFDKGLRSSIQYSSIVYLITWLEHMCYCFRPPAGRGQCVSMIELTVWD